MRQLHAVGHAFHVVDEGDAAHAGELNAAGLDDVSPAALELLAAGGDLSAHGVGAFVVEAAIFPVAVWAEHGRARSLRGRFRPIERSGDVVARKRLEDDALDGIVVALDLAVDDRIERAARGHRVQPGGHQHAGAYLRAARGPIGLRRRGPWGMQRCPENAACRAGRREALGRQAARGAFPPPGRCGPMRPRRKLTANTQTQDRWNMWLSFRLNCRQPLIISRGEGKLTILRKKLAILAGKHYHSRG